jgi:hypothetical protein
MKRLLVGIYFMVGLTLPAAAEIPNSSFFSGNDVYD